MSQKDKRDRYKSIILHMLDKNIKILGECQDVIKNSPKATSDGSVMTQVFNLIGDTKKLQKLMKNIQSTKSMINGDMSEGDS